jgi:hypothetical protein
MDLIEDRLTTYSRNKKYSPSIRAAVRLGKKTLNRYYELTDTSEVYRIAMGKFLNQPFREGHSLGAREATSNATQGSSENPSSAPGFNSNDNPSSQPAFDPYVCSRLGSS